MMTKEEYEKELSSMANDISELNKDLDAISFGMDSLGKNIENIRTAQDIINSLSETADIVNHTVNPLEFFEGYDKMYYLVNKLESVPDIKYSQQPPNEIREELIGQRKPAIQKMIGRYYNYTISKGYSIDVFYNTLSKYFSYMDHDHMNYINQLHNNGNKRNNETAKKIRRIKNFYINLSYIINRILFPPAKVMFFLWTFSWISTISADEEVSFGHKICIILFGYIFMCGIADLIYSRNKNKYLQYKIKITQKKMNRLKKLMKEIDPVAYQRDFFSQDSSENTITKSKNNIVNYDYMNGHQFEYFCADILRKNGFINVEVTQGSGDHGIDVLAEKDSITYAIQCKCYSSNIGNAAVQQAHTGKSLYHKDIAVVMTNRYFTPQAMAEAKALGVKLWDRNKLNEMISNQ